MGPYLEHPLWPGVYKRLIAAIADALAPQLRPKYLVALEERIYQTTGEDLLLVGGEVVTAIELLILLTETSKTS